MQVPTPVYAALFALATIAPALAPAYAAGEAANPGIGECELHAGGFYFNFTTMEFCSPNGGGGDASTGGGTETNGGSTATEPSPGLIVIHNPVQGSIYCGALTDAFVDRSQDCPKKPGSGSCSRDGCATCSEDGCRIPSRPGRPVQAQRGKPQQRTRKPTRKERHDACRAYADDQRRVFAEYQDVFELVLKAGFTWKEALGQIWWNEITEGLNRGTITIRSGVTNKVVRVPPTPDTARFRGPDGRIKRFAAEQTHIALLIRRYSCGEFDDIDWTIPLPAIGPV